MSTVIRRNQRIVAAQVNDPDQFSMHVATAMALYTNTFSPAAAGVEPSGTRGFMAGDRGYGANRQGGLTSPLQFFVGAARAIAPVGDPKSRRLGIGALPSGQPGWPGTTTDANAGTPTLMAWQLGPGFGA